MKALKWSSNFLILIFSLDILGVIFELGVERKTQNKAFWHKSKICYEKIFSRTPRVSINTLAILSENNYG